MSVRKHINIPVFIPHLGCPNTCVFCNQRAISGSPDLNPDNLSFVTETIERTLSTAPPDAEREIAFFGGSFTGIDRDLMTALLDIAAAYAASGRISSIRLSTRPDYIDEEIISILKKYPVGTVELGIQSMDDRVLAACRRGHTAERSRIACAMVLEAGFKFVGQMMVGLPGADGASEIYTARSICEMKASGARVYPTVVFRDTELLDMTARGEYAPLDEASAVSRTKDVLSVFAEHSVPVFRVGLCASDSLSSPDCAVAGATHPAVGEMAMGELYYDVMRRELRESGVIPGGAQVTFIVPAGEVSKCAGQHRRNILRLTEEFGLSRVRFSERQGLLPYTVMIQKTDNMPRTGGATVVS